MQRSESRQTKAEETNPFDQLRGIVEPDETYIDGKIKRRFGCSKENQRSCSEKFDMVLGIRERTQRAKKPARAEFVHIPDGEKESIREAVRKHAVPNPERIYRDEVAAHPFGHGKQLNKKHRTVNH